MMKLLLMRGPKADRGATLIELVVVLAVLALIAVSIVPMTTSSRRTAELNAAAHLLVSKLTAVRSAALQLGREQAMFIDPLRRCYWADGVFTPVALAGGLTVDVDGGADNTTYPRIVVFSARGSATTAVIRIGNGAAMRDVIVDADTGTARLVR